MTPTTPNPKPAPAPEPKCYHCETCRKQCSPKTGQPICCNCKCELAAPEPKQGSEEPIEPVTELEAEKSTSKILRALLAKAEAERDEARATKDMHKERQEEAWAEVAALRAEVERLKAIEPSAEMRAPTTPTVEMVRLRQSNQNLMMLYANAIGECRKINKAIHRVLRGRNNAVKQLAAEKARADRAEERVKVLEDVVVNANRVGWNEALSMEASSINAARARKEGGSNA